MNQIAISKNLPMDAVQLGIHPTKGATAVFTGKQADKVTDAFIIIFVLLAIAGAGTVWYKYIRS